MLRTTSNLSDKGKTYFFSNINLYQSVYYYK